MLTRLKQEIKISIFNHTRYEVTEGEEYLRAGRTFKSLFVPTGFYLAPFLAGVVVWLVRQRFRGLKKTLVLSRSQMVVSQRVASPWPRPAAIVNIVDGP